MRAIIVDDEQPAIDLLAYLLSQDKRIDIVGTFSKPAEALAAIGSLQPDVAFLDIQMPKMNGIDLSARLADQYGDDVIIVFVTASDQYALKAIKANACDYLLKPVMVDDLKQTIHRLFKRKAPRASVQPLPQAEPCPQPFPPISLYCFGKFALLDPDQQNVHWRTGKAQELTAFLYLHRDQEISKWKIIDAIWPDLSEDQAGGYLHTTVYLVRKALKKHHIDASIHFSLSHYRLVMNGLISDLELFLGSLDKIGAVTAATAGQIASCLQLYKGDLFGDWDYGWSNPAREKLRQRFSVVTRQLSAHYFQDGNISAATNLLQNLIQQQPLDEEPYELLLAIYITTQNRVAFMELYRRLVSLLHQELGIEPNAGIRQLFASWS